MGVQTSYGQDYFSNLREGDSRYIGDPEKSKLAEVYKKHGKNSLERRFNQIFEEKKVATCASKIVAELGKIGSSQEQKEVLALAMRDLEIIDDIALDIIIKRNKIKYEASFPSLQSGKISLKEIKKDYETFEKRINEGFCPEDAFFGLTSALYKKKLGKNGKIKAANKVARKSGILSKKNYQLAESFRRAKVQFWSLSLSQYNYKLQALRRQVEAYGQEKSDFVTVLNKKAKMSLRQHIYSNYSYLQIVMMGNLVEKMRKRLDSVDISIIIRYADDEQTEIIPLEPTERFRFVLKLLRKEMAKLNQMSLFDNSKAHYAAVIAASYEVGAVPAIELEELASLEEIWNPKRTRMDRIMSWARMFGGVASVVIPGPFAFLPVLTVMVVDGIVTEPKPDRDQDISLF